MAGGNTFYGQPWKLPYTKEQLVSAAENQIPIIGDNGNWFRWSIATSQWEDTGTCAKAGKSPYIGANGYWYEWDDEAKQYVNTGKIASMADVIIPSHNILINSDFRQPVNRQGKVEYVGSGYAIDRWRMRSEIEVKVAGTGIHLSLNNTSYLKGFSQPVENPKQYAGLTLTFSVLLANNTMELASDSYAGWGAWLAATDATHTQGIGRVQPEGNGLFSVTFTVPEDFGEYEYLNAGLYAARCTGSADVKACKLELGDKQTLAHQDEEGNWVLNDPPNYDLQYLLTSLYSPTTGEWVGIQHSNPNLLDNWYFIGGGSQQGGGQFPINQRGEAEYTGTKATYAIDRWIIDTSSQGNCKLDVLSDCIRVTKTYAIYNPPCPRQLIENFDCKKGTTLTLSILARGNALTRLVMIFTGIGQKYKTYTPTSTDDWGIYIFTYTLEEDTALEQVNIGQLMAENEVGKYLDIAAAKLELGPVQTLARQDADGNWVLNDPPPNYQQELAKCQRYQIALGGITEKGNAIGIGTTIKASSVDARVFVPIPVTLRASPTAVFTPQNWRLRIGTTYYNPTDIATFRTATNGVTLQVLAPNLPEGATVELRTENKDEIAILDANL